MRFRFINFVLVCLVCFAASAVQAAVIYLKDGSKIEGEIITDEPTRIQVMVGGIPRTIFRGEIDRMTGIPGIEVGVTDLTKKDLRDYEDIPAAKRNLITRLLDANGAKENMRQTFARLLNHAPPEKRAMVRDALNLEDLMKELIPLYDRYYTDSELQEMIRFYSSPTGTKLIKVTPFLMKDAMDTSVDYFKSKAGLSVE